MLDLLVRGGWVMYPILACSVIAVAITVERIFYYVFSRNNRKDIFMEISAFVKAGKIKEAVKFCSTGNCHTDCISRTYLENCDKNKNILEESLQVTAAYEIRRLEKYLPALSLISNLSTLLGLLGTVIGMILVFSEIAKAGGQAEMAQLADGVWQALLTTAFGLIVAVPVMAFHHFFQKHVEDCISDMEIQISRLNILFGRKCSVKFDELADKYDDSANVPVEVDTDTAGVSGGGVY